MDDRTRAFQDHRDHLVGVAHRMLGSQTEAEDAVQEAWLRLDRSDTGDVQNLRAWLTVVVARVCLDMLRSRKSRGEQELGPKDVDATVESPEHAMATSDAIAVALLVVLETLDPAERVAFVLHDLFAVPFDQIAGVVGKSVAAARQLASRARRRVQAAGAVSEQDRKRDERVVGAFLAASRDGNFEALLAVLDPDVVLRADPAAVQTASARVERGAPPLKDEIRGAKDVATTFLGRAAAARPATIDRAPGAVWAPGGQPRAAFLFTLAGDKIVGIEIVFEREAIAELEVVLDP